MPYPREDAPPGLPDSETIEALLGERNTTTSAGAKTTKAMDELTDEERQRTHLVTIGKRCIRIPGDPYGIYPSWAGNVAHPRDYRMFDIMEPIFDQLLKSTIIDSHCLRSLRTVLEKIPTTDLELLAKEMAGEQYSVVCRTAKETIVEFQLDGKDVRLMQAHDINKDAPTSYDEAHRCRQAKMRADVAFDEPPMSISLQQYLMAQLLRDQPAGGPPNTEEKFFKNLRSAAQEKFWLLLSKAERSRCRTSHTDPDPTLDDFLSIIKDNWHSSWNGEPHDKDFFRNYAEDKVAAEQAWELIPADVFVVIDCNRQVVFANVVGLMQLLYGEATTHLLTRCLDNWSYFAPLPLPETCRHVVDNHVRRIHPELDIENVTVEKLANAKMGVAHYGCWSDKFDPSGKRVVRTADAAFSRSKEQAFCRSLFPQFAEAALGKATSVIRFLVKPLDPEYYADCVAILKTLPPDEKIRTDDEDFLSLFALGVNGYTQRHRDIKDINGGMAGLFTLGQYTGADLCVPQLGIRTRYSPGSCAILRGDKLDHLVRDYSGPRFFIVGTNHNSTARYAWRKMGRPDKITPVTEDDSNAPCINEREDEDDDISWTNEQIHGPAALRSESTSEGTTT